MAPMKNGTVVIQFNEGRSLASGAWAGNGPRSAGDISGTLGGGSEGTGILRTLVSDAGGEREIELD